MRGEPAGLAGIQPRVSTLEDEKVAAALLELGFRLTEKERDEIQRGKDFIQLRNGPFDLDLIFAPDGVERFEDVESAR